MLLSRQSGYNPFFLNFSENHHACVSNEVHCIYFYDEKTQMIVAESQWFGSNNEYKEFYLCKGIEPVRKLKANLTSKVPFYTKAQNDYQNYTKRIDIYVPLCCVDNFEKSEHVKDFECKTYTRYADKVSFTASAIRRTYNRTLQDFVYPEQATEQVVSFSCNYDHVDTPFENECKRIAEKAKAKGVKLDSYEVGKLLEVFNITDKA